MAKVTFIQVIYNHKRFIEPVFSAIMRQTIPDFDVVAVISGNQDGSKEFLLEKFPEAQVCAVDELANMPAKIKVWDPGYNIGFAKGHNEVFARMKSDFFQLVNPDFIMEPNYAEEMLKAFGDPRVGAATGKLYKFNDLKFNIEDFRDNKILDTTGVVISKSGRGRDRGQHEVDHGQYDNSHVVDAVSAAGAMYRALALAQVKVPKKIQNPCLAGRQAKSKIQTTGNREFEFFDEDFHSYWEDADLGWRMTNAGWKCVFRPSAVGYHGRGAGSSEGGYKKVGAYIKFHKTISPQIRQLNYRNHIFMYIKNSRWFYPQFFAREFFMFFYILLFEAGTLKAIPEIFKLLPKMWRKRKVLKHLTQ